VRLNTVSALGSMDLSALVRAPKESTGYYLYIVKILIF
jgi:hypothetical protein